MVLPPVRESRRPQCLIMALGRIPVVRRGVPMVPKSCPSMKSTSMTTAVWSSSSATACPMLQPQNRTPARCRLVIRSSKSRPIRPKCSQTRDRIPRGRKASVHPLLVGKFRSQAVFLRTRRPRPARLRQLCRHPSPVWETRQFRVNRQSAPLLQLQRTNRQHRGLRARPPQPQERLGPVHRIARSLSR